MSIEVMVRQMTAGFGQTCLIFFLTLIFSLPLGMIVYFGRVCRFKPLSWLVKIYISIMRGTPSYIEMFAVAKQIAAAQTTVVPFFIAGIFYYVFNYVVAWVMELFEKKLNYYR